MRSVFLYLIKIGIGKALRAFRKLNEKLCIYCTRLRESKAEAIFSAKLFFAFLGCVLNFKRIIVNGTIVWRNLFGSFRDMLTVYLPGRTVRRNDSNFKLTSCEIFEKACIGSSRIFHIYCDRKRIIFGIFGFNTIDGFKRFFYNSKRVLPTVLIFNCDSYLSDVVHTDA